MRLIDADLLAKEIESFRYILTGLRNGKGVLAKATDEYRKRILQIIEDQPTAFDKEKVIDELQKPDPIIRTFIGKSFTTIDRAIEIVEKGGIE